MFFSAGSFSPEPWREAMSVQVWGPTDQSALVRSTSQGLAGFLPSHASRILLAASGRNINDRLGSRRLFSSSTESCTREVTSSLFLKAPLFSCCQAVGTRVEEQGGQTRILCVHCTYARVSICKSTRASAGPHPVTMATQDWVQQGQSDVG